MAVWTVWTCLARCNAFGRQPVCQMGAMAFAPYSVLCCQVAKLQGTAEGAAENIGQGSIELDSSQQWIRQQADVMASIAHMHTPHASTASQLGFLPDFMTQAAAEQAAGPGIAAAAQIATTLAEPSVTDAAAVTHQGAGNQPSGEVDARSHITTQVSLDRPGVQADKQQPEAADTAKPQTPTTWLEWEQQLQVAPDHSCQTVNQYLTMTGCTIEQFAP